MSYIQYYTPRKHQNVFLTADSHYGHSNLCSATSKWSDKSRCRQFNSLNEMNNALVNGINSVVQPQDVLIHHGDWSFGGKHNIPIFRERLACLNIVLILGNHDHHIMQEDRFKKLFTRVMMYNEFRWSKTKYFCQFHYPIASWNGIGKGYYMTHGHCHQTLDKRLQDRLGRILDVGVEGNNYRPWHIDEVVKWMESKEPSQVDHHDRKTNTK